MLSQNRIFINLVLGLLFSISSISFAWSRTSTHISSTTLHYDLRCNRRDRLSMFLRRDATKANKLTKQSSSLLHKNTHNSLLVIRGGALSEIVSSLSTISPASFSNLPLPLAASHPIVNDVIVTTALVSEVYIWLKFWTTLAQQKILPSVLTRKIIHAGSAPLFVLHWPLFSQSPQVSLVAACIPALQILRLYMAGSGGWKWPWQSLPPTTREVSQLNKAENNGDKLSHKQDIVKVQETKEEISELIAAVSRTGRREEALGGPFLYSIVLFFATIFWFRSSAIGVVAIAQMAAGDGLADIIGRRYGQNNKWFWSQRKSIAGSLGFVLGGWLCSYGLVQWLQYCGYLSGMTAVYGSVSVTLLLISVVCAAVELFPIVDDNISVPMVAALVTALLLPTIYS